MAGSTTARGAAADAKAEGGDAAVEVSDAGVEVAPSVSDEFTPVTMYHRDGRKLEVDSLEGSYNAKFNGFTTKKPAKS